MLANEHLMVGLSAKCPALGLNWLVHVNYNYSMYYSTIFFCFIPTPKPLDSTCTQHLVYNCNDLY
jgi:hypothetical protein